MRDFIFDAVVFEDTILERTPRVYKPFFAVNKD